MDWIIEPVNKTHLPEILELEKISFPGITWPASMIFCEINLNPSARYFVALDESKSPSPGKEGDVEKLLKDILRSSEEDTGLDKILKEVISSKEKEKNVDRLLKEINSSSEFFKPCRVIGYGGMWLKLRQAHITTLAVHPEYRRKGVALSLVLRLLKEARKAKAGHVVLEVKKTNTAAQKLYKKLGFKMLGTRKNYYIEDGEDGIVMFLENLKGKKVEKTIKKFEELLGGQCSC